MSDFKRFAVVGHGVPQFDHRADARSRRRAHLRAEARRRAARRLERHDHGRLGQAVPRQGEGCRAAKAGAVMSNISRTIRRRGAKEQTMTTEHEPINGHDVGKEAEPTVAAGWYLHKLDVPFPAEAQPMEFAAPIPAPAKFQRAYLYRKQESALVSLNGPVPPTKTLRIVFLSVWKAPLVERAFMLSPGMIPIGPGPAGVQPQLFETVVDPQTSEPWALWGPHEVGA